MTKRIAVGVSGGGLEPAGAPRGGGARRARRGDRPRLRRPGLPGARLGRRAGDRHRPDPRRRRRRPCAKPSPAPRPTPSSWPATCGSSGRRCSARSRGRILNTHPSLLPAFPGAHAVRDALAAGVRVTGATVHLVDETLDGGPIVLQEAVEVLPGDDEATLHERIKAVEHRLLPRAVALLLAGAVGVASGRPPRRDRHRGGGRGSPRPAPRAPLGLRQDRAWRRSPGASSAKGSSSSRPAAPREPSARRASPVTDVAAVTGFAEMLDGRVKTLHPRVHAGILADRRLADHREQLIAASIAPFELVVVNLYPFAAAAERPGHHARRARRGDRHRRAVDGPCRREEPRQRRDRHVAGALRRRPRGGRRRRPGPRRAAGGARDRGVPPHGRLRRADRRRAAGPDGRGRRRRCPTSPASPAPTTRSRRA